MSRILLLPLCSLLMVSCHSYKVFEIETFTPSAITFPSYVNTLMIINNSARQPDCVGHKVEGYGNETICVSSDSMAYDLCLSLGRLISEAEIFDDVRLCEDTLRRDSVFFEIRLFSKEEVEQICDDYGVDAIITLDRLVFNTNLSRVYASYGFFSESCLEIEISGELHVYWPGEKEISTFPFRDSLFWYNESGIPFQMDSPRICKYINDGMHFLSNYSGEKLYVNFVPHWLTGERWYYTSFSSEWNQASAFAGNKKWDEAGIIWENLLKKTKNKKQRARLYSNIAVCSEMKGDFGKAVENAEKSCESYKNVTSDEENDPFVKVQKRYIEILKERLNNDGLLSKQLKEKL